MSNHEKDDMVRLVDKSIHIALSFVNPPFERCIRKDKHLTLDHLEQALMELKMPPRDLTSVLIKSLNITAISDLFKSHRLYQSHRFHRIIEPSNEILWSIATYFHLRSHPPPSFCHHCDAEWSAVAPAEWCAVSTLSELPIDTPVSKFQCSLCRHWFCISCRPSTLSPFLMDICCECEKRYECRHCHKPQILDQNCTVCGKPGCPPDYTQSCHFCQIIATDWDGPLENMWWLDTGHSMNSDVRCCTHSASRISTCRHFTHERAVCIRHRRGCVTCKTAVVGCIGCLSHRAWVLSVDRQCSDCRASSYSALDSMFGRDLSILLLNSLFEPLRSK